MFRILLVDDEAQERDGIRFLIEKYKLPLTVVEAQNGQKALEKFKASGLREYSCILMDIQMPVMDGYQATEAIRALPRADAKEIPIIALTANAFAADLGKAHSAGMDDHIAKPIDMQVLVEALGRLMA